MSGFLNRRSAAAGLLAAAVGLASVAPAAAQTTPSTGTKRTNTTQTTTTPTTTTSTGQTGTTTSGTTPTQLTGPWLEIAMLAESLKAELNLSFDNPWEDLFFFLLVAELYFELNGQLGTQPDGTGTATQPAATPPSTGGLGTGGFGTGGTGWKPIQRTTGGTANTGR